MSGHDRSTQDEWNPLQENGPDVSVPGVTRAEILLMHMWEDLAAVREVHQRDVAILRNRLERQVQDLRRQLDEAPTWDRVQELEDHAEMLERRLEELAQQLEEAPSWERVTRLEDRAEELQQELEGVYASETWSTGRTMLYLPRQLKRWWRRVADDGRG